MITISKKREHILEHKGTVYSYFGKARKEYKQS
ncbi:hypothetical protein SAMN05216238_104315 [Lentibacillus persicus]|uniref:Uncharacterized protein n=1 Tax=Lentibacillus persicus TaxID=640948 RepID=A0A1I1VSU7_9BACI|nr:hypothetical protein SAMN05216238_104315 [Lentibacillus persicus]